MKKIIKRNKYKILYYVILLILFCLAYVIFSLYPSLKFFLIIPIFLFLGLPLPSFFKNVFNVKNILHYFLLSLFFGFFFHTFIIFSLGIIGVSISLTLFTIYIPIIIFINTLLYLVYVPEEEVQKYFSNFKPTAIDIVWNLAFFGIFLFFIQLTTERFFPNWDNFTYWAIDAKYIFENNSLDGRNLDLLQKSYYPFYPLQLSYIYFLYGEVVEQFSSLLTLLYGYLSLLLLSSFIIDLKRGLIQKSLLYFLSFAGFWSYFVSLNTLVTQYADVYCGVLIFLYGIALFSRAPTKKNFPIRVLLIFLFSLALYLTKHAYAPISLLLIMIFLLYDASFILQLIKATWTRRKYILFLLIAIFLLSIVPFAIKINFIKNVSQYFHLLTEIDLFTKVRFLYLINILRYLLNKIPEFILTIIILFSNNFFISNNFLKKERKKILVVLVLALIPIFFYFLLMKDTKNGSLLRYESLVFFLIPFLFINISQKCKETHKISGYFLMIIAAFVAFSMFLQVAIEYEFKWEFTPNSGRYSESLLLKESYLFSREIQDTVGKETSIMLVGEESGKKLGNINPPNLYIRYYLAEQSVGSQYIVPIEEWNDYLRSYNPEYIFVSKYSNFWPKCNSLLKQDSSYLIKIEEEHLSDEENDCFFHPENVFKITI